MVRVGAKRERPCMVVLHMAIRSTTATPTTTRSHTVWKTSRTAQHYARAVLCSVRAYGQLLGGVRYASPDSLTVASAVWSAADEAAAAPPRAVGDAKPLCPPRSSCAVGRRSGVLRCAVHLPRSLYGDAGAVNILRAACACVVQASVEVPVALLGASAGVGGEEEEEDAIEPTRQRRRRADPRSVDVISQLCSVAVRVARVEHVLPSRQQR